MATAITTITTPLGTTQTLTGTSAKDDFFTINTTVSANGFASTSTITSLLQNADGTLTYKLLDVVKNITTTINLPSPTSTNAIEFINRLGSSTATSNGVFQIMAPDNYATSTISNMYVYGTSGNDKITLPTSTTASAVTWGGPGDDTIVGSGGTSTIYAGTGNNLITGNGSVQDLFRAFTADKSTDIITENSRVGVHEIQIYLPSTVIKAWSFKQVGNDLQGSVTDGNSATYNFTVKDQYAGKEIQGIFLYSIGTPGTFGTGSIAGGDLTSYIISATTWAFLAGTNGNNIFDMSTQTRAGARMFGNDGNDKVIAKDAVTNNFYGGAGLNNIVYPKASTEYAITYKSATVLNVLPSKATTADYLQNVQRLNFTDKSIAYDTTANAGTVAKVLGAVFGKTAVTNKTFVGIGLSYVDKGMSYSDLATLALNAAGSTTPDQIVTTLWTNVIGSAPSATDKAPYIQMLASGTKVGDLAVLAADTSFNTTNINLTGLAQTGIEYTSA
jgi:hypothetical protein